MSKMVKMVLESNEFNVFSHSNGDDLLTKLSTVRPSLILLDVNMPGVDGYTLCSEIREQNPDLKCAIAFLTASKGQEDVLLARQVGGDYFITKPFTLKSLLDGVTKAFKIRKR